MIVMGIDPGTTKSGFVMYCSNLKSIHDKGIIDNEDMVGYIRGLGILHMKPDVIVIERIKNYGMPMGDSTIDTIFWSGRFCEARDKIYPFRDLTRNQVKMQICGSPRAKDANIRQALIDRFPANGGGKIPQIGTKKQPGPLYGMKEDMWAALALAITYAESRNG